MLHWTGGKPDGISNDQVRYSHDNLTGSSGLELDGEGKVISTEEYYPYGGTAVWTARSAVEADYKTVRYSGKERDATGLYYYGYRYYQPWAGRWLSSDPAGAVDGLNLFRMVRNNPVTLRDVNGLISSAQLEQITSNILKRNPGSIDDVKNALSYMQLTTGDVNSIIRYIQKQPQFSGLPDVSRLKISEEDAVSSSSVSGKNEPDRSNDFLSLVDIRTKGKLLGSGVYGTAYKLNDDVYKIYNDRLGGHLAGMDVIINKKETISNNKDGWNHFYKNAYGGKYSEFATAKIVSTIEKEDVLKTPYINGDDISDREYDKSKFKVALIDELSLLGRKMVDNNASNVKINESSALIIDFDRYEKIRIPLRKEGVVMDDKKQQAALKIFGF